MDTFDAVLKSTKTSQESFTTKLIFCFLCLIFCDKEEIWRIPKSHKVDALSRKLRIWSHLLNKSLTENFIFCAVLHNNKRFLRMVSSQPKYSIVNNKRSKPGSKPELGKESKEGVLLQS